MRRLLSPDRQLVLGRTTAALAFGLIPTTLILAVARATGSALDIGLVLACELVPMVLLLPVSGVVADRFSPQRVILAADLLRCAAQFVIACEFLTGRFHIVDLSILAAVTGVGMAFGMPAGRRLVAGTIPPEDRLRVNSRLSVSTALAQLVGPAIAGTLVLGVGAGWASMSTAALFAFSALTLGGIPAIRTSAPATRGSIVADLREGWTEVRRHPWFLACVQGHGVRHLTAGFLFTLGPLIAIDRHGDDSAWVFIAQAGVVGTVLGGYAARRVTFGLPLVVCAIGSACYALPLTALALPSPVAVIATAYFLAMVGNGMLTPLWDTTLQQRIPEAALGRVGSYDILISLASRPVGLAVAAPLAGWIGTDTVLFTGSALVAIANLAAVALPSVRKRYGGIPDEPDARPVPEKTAVVRLVSDDRSERSLLAVHAPQCYCRHFGVERAVVRLIRAVGCASCAPLQRLAGRGQSLTIASTAPLAILMPAIPLQSPRSPTPSKAIIFTGRPPRRRKTPSSGWASRWPNGAGS